MPTTSALRRSPRTTLALVALVAVALAAAGLGLRGSAAARAPGATTLTFTELDRGSTFQHIRNTKTNNRRSNLMGDIIVFTNPIADAAGKGSAEATSSASPPSARATSSAPG